MLPFLKPKREVGLLIQERKPDGDMPESSQEGSDDPGLMSAAEEICKGVESKDYSRIASAIRSAFDILNSSPSEGNE